MIRSICHTSVIALAMMAVFQSQALAGPIDLTDTGNGAAVISESGRWNNQAQFDASNVLDENVTEPPFGGEGGSGEHEWLGREGVLGESFTVKLSQAAPISEIDLYDTHNGTYNDRGTADFHIVAGNAVDSNGNIVGGTTILTGTLSPTDGDAVIPAQVFTSSNGLSSSATPYQYIQFYADTATHNNDVGLNEIDVYGTASTAPEPASLVLFALGLAPLALARARGRKVAQV